MAKRTIEINLDNLAFDEWDIVAELVGGKTKITPAVIDFLKRVIVGGTKGLDFADMMRVIEALTDAMTAMFNPTDAEGKN